jgi:hypothetical protein
MAAESSRRWEMKCLLLGSILIEEQQSSAVWSLFWRCSTQLGGFRPI